MGAQGVVPLRTPEARARFLEALLRDIEALERMLQQTSFDTELRVGAEQEYVLLDAHLSPAPIAGQVLAQLDDPRFVREVGRFALEANLTPRPFGPGCLLGMRAELEEVTRAARAACRRLGAHLLLAGIAPTFDAVHARLAHMTQAPRFEEFNRATMEAAGGRLRLTIQGRDTWSLWHDNYMLEAGPTSFQVHLQVTPETFARAFNTGLLVAAPLMALAANAALVGGRRLWHDTRIPLLERCQDIRTPAQSMRGGPARTVLGDGFVEESVLEVHRRDLARFPVVVGSEHPEDPSEVLARGGVPALTALTTFSGTVWRWLRPCYGVVEGKPHLRLENRVMSAGPTLVDEVANAAFWLGLMEVLPQQWPDVSRRIPFEEVEANFHAAARDGLEATFVWPGAGRVKARELVRSELLPLAREGLRRRALPPGELELLSVLEERVRTGQSGAEWMLRTFESLPASLPHRAKAWCVTSAMLRLGEQGSPVARWPVGDALAPGEPSVWAGMRSDFKVLGPEAPVALAQRVLGPGSREALVVEDASGAFVGLYPPGDGEPRAPAGGDERGCQLGEVAWRTPVVLEATLPIGAALERLAAAGAQVGVVLRHGLAMGLVYREELLTVLEACAPPGCSPSWGGPSPEAGHGQPLELGG